ncbi:hypothetical protein ISCGN_030131 [Ixodes scapularis]
MAPAMACLPARRRLCIILHGLCSSLRRSSVPCVPSICAFCCIMFGRLRINQGGTYAEAAVRGTRSLSKASVGTQYSLRDTECPPSPLTPTETSVGSQTPEAPQKLTKSKAFPQRLAPKVRVVLDPTRSQVRKGSPPSSAQGVEEAMEVNVPFTEGSMETATPVPSCSKAGNVSSAPQKKSAQASQVPAGSSGRGRAQPTRLTDNARKPGHSDEAVSLRGPEVSTEEKMEEAGLASDDDLLPSGAESLSSSAGGTCESRCLESGVSTDPEPCVFARPRLTVRGFPVSGEKGILVVERNPGSCEHLKRKKEILTLKVKENISYLEAKRRLLGFQRGSFAEVVRRVPAPTMASVKTQVSYGDLAQPLKSSGPKLKVQLSGRVISAAQAGALPNCAKGSDSSTEQTEATPSQMKGTSGAVHTAPPRDDKLDAGPSGSTRAQGSAFPAQGSAPPGSPFQPPQGRGLGPSAPGRSRTPGELTRLQASKEEPLLAPAEPMDESGSRSDEDRPPLEFRISTSGLRWHHGQAK